MPAMPLSHHSTAEMRNELTNKSAICYAVFTVSDFIVQTQMIFCRQKLESAELTLVAQVCAQTGKMRVLIFKCITNPIVNCFLLKPSFIYPCLLISSDNSSWSYFLCM